VIEHVQSAVDAAGPEAARIEWLWWVFFWVSVVVWVAVVVVLAGAIIRGRRQRELPAAAVADRAMRPVVIGATALTVLILFGLLGASIGTGRSLSRLDRQAAVTIGINARQWWWEATYEDGTPSEWFTTANELHIPVGQPVIVRGTSSDVIHSFWVPNLHGKVDLIPGRNNLRWIQADVAGTYRGQCAEFCGLQHARMALTVVAEPMEKFEAWRRAQRQPAREPQDETQRRGRAVFESATCVMCHTVRGTAAAGRVAPDLTHLKSRLTLAAGTLPNTRGHLAGWILDPQSVKPGNHMPPSGLASDEVQALLAYLDSLH
jgi:cytochrome c oxidase subunit II